VAEVAKAASSAAVGDVAGAALHTAAAGLHFAASKTFAIGAAIAGGAGVALALGARAAGGGGVSKENSGAFGSSGSRDKQDDKSPLSRSGPGTFDSGRRPDSPLVEIARHLAENRRVMDANTAAINTFTAKYAPVSAGQLLEAGTKQRPGLVARQFAKDVGENPSLGNKAKRNLGFG